MPVRHRCLCSEECEIECGNGVFDPGEECEVDWEAGMVAAGGGDCISEGFDAGTLGCAPGCVYDTAGCRNQTCGDGFVDSPEECDGADLRGSTCESLGFAGGILACTAGCMLDAGGCFSCEAPLTNGSFECGPFPPPPGYLTLPQGSLEVCGWMVTDDDLDLTTTYWVASDGEKSLDLNRTQPGAIAQTLPTTPGLVYHVSFDMAGNPGELRHGVARMEVLAAGQSAILTVAVGDHGSPPYAQMDWTPMTWSFTAAAATTTLEFRSLNLDSGAGGPALDNVRVTTCP